MRAIAVVLALVVLGVISAGFISKTQQSDEPKRTFASVQSDMQQGARLYDVRTPEEFQAGHFEGAMNHSLQALQAGQFPSVSKETQIYVYCRSGNRSAQAAEVLKVAGYSNVTDLGGLGDVQAMGGTLKS